MTTCLSKIRGNNQHSDHAGSQCGMEHLKCYTATNGSKALRSGEACYSSILCSAGYIAIFIAGSGKAAVSPAITRTLPQIHIGSIYTVTVIIS